MRLFLMTKLAAVYHWFMALLTESTVTASDWKPVIDALTSQISVQTVVAVIAAVVTACIGLVFMWWGVRKGSKALMSAFKSGKLKF